MCSKSENLLNQVAVSQQNYFQRLFSQLGRLQIEQAIDFFHKIKLFLNQQPHQPYYQSCALLDKKYNLLRFVKQIILSAQYSYYLIFTIELFSFLVSIYRNQERFVHSKRGITTVKSQKNIMISKNDDKKSIEFINSKSRILVKQILTVFGCSKFKFHPFSEYQFDSRLACDIQSFIPSFSRQIQVTRKQKQSKRKLFSNEQIQKYQVQRKRLKRGFICSPDYNKVSRFLVLLVEKCFQRKRQFQDNNIQSSITLKLQLMRKIIISRDSASIKTVVHSVSKFIPKQLPKRESELNVYFNNAMIAIEVLRDDKIQITDCIVKSGEIQAIEQTKVACLKKFLFLLLQLIKYTKKRVQAIAYQQGYPSKEYEKNIPKQIVETSEQIKQKAKKIRKIIIDRLILWSWATKRVGLQQLFYSSILKAIYGNKQYTRARHQAQKKQYDCNNLRFESHLLRIFKTNQQKLGFVKRIDKQTMQFQDHQVIKRLQQEIMNYSQSLFLNSESSLFKQGSSDFRKHNFRIKSEQEMSFKVSDSKNDECSFNVPSDNQFVNLRGPTKKFTSYQDISSKSYIRSEQLMGYLNLGEMEQNERKKKDKQKSQSQVHKHFQIRQYYAKYPSQTSQQVGAEQLSKRGRWQLAQSKQKEIINQPSVVFFESSRQKSVDKSSKIFLKDSLKKRVKIKETSLKRSKSGNTLSAFSIKNSQPQMQQENQVYSQHSSYHKSLNITQSEYGLNFNVRRPQNQLKQWNYTLNVSANQKQSCKLSQQIIQFEESISQQKFDHLVISNSSIVAQYSTFSSEIKDKQFGSNAKIPKSQKKPKFGFTVQQKYNSIQSPKAAYHLNNFKPKEILQKQLQQPIFLIEKSYTEPFEYQFQLNTHLLNESHSSVLSSNVINDSNFNEKQSKSIKQIIKRKDDRSSKYSQQNNKNCFFNQQKTQKGVIQNSYSRFSQLIRDQKKKLATEKIFTFKQIQNALLNKKSNVQNKILKIESQRSKQCERAWNMEDQLGELKQQNIQLYNAIQDRIEIGDKQLKYSVSCQALNEMDLIKQENSILMALLKMKMQEEHRQKYKVINPIQTKNNQAEKPSSLSCIIMQSKCFNIQNAQLVNFLPRRIQRKFKTNLRSQKGLIVNNQFLQIGFTRNQLKKNNVPSQTYLSIYITFLKPYSVTKLLLQTQKCGFKVLNKSEIPSLFNCEQFPVGKQSKFTLKLQQYISDENQSNFGRIIAQFHIKNLGREDTKISIIEGLIPISRIHFVEFTKQQHSQEWINMKKSQLHKFYSSPWFKVSHQIEKHCMKNDLKQIGELLKMYFGQFENQIVNKRYYQFYSCCRKTNGNMLLFRINIDIEKSLACVEFLDKTCNSLMYQIAQIVGEQQN